MAALDDGARRLRSGATLWQSRNPAGVAGTVAPRHGQRRRADIVIVGAGITGAFLAERLSRAGKTVVVIDRRTPLTGSTTASTAMLQWELDAPMVELEGRFGFDMAKAIIDQSRRAVASIAALVLELGIACSLHPRASIYLSGNELDVVDLREEHKIRSLAKIKGAHLDQNDLAGLGFMGDGALFYPGSAEVDPLALAQGLMRAAIARGVVVLSPATAANYEPTLAGVSVITDEGEAIFGASLILANGYEMPSMVPAHAHRIRSTWALATKPLGQPFWRDRALVWEAADPYLYFRSADDRIVAGGEDQDIPDPDQRDALTPAKTKAILEKLAARFPALQGVEADFAWAGFFGETTDSLPLIGPVPGSPNCFAAFGYGGNGITFSAIAADLLSNLLEGQRHPLLDAYALDRSG